MRTHTTVRQGQIWQASDPRRLRLVEVCAISGSHGKGTQTLDEPAVIVRVLYPTLPIEQQAQYVPFRAFLTTGTKGYVRVK